MSTLPAIISRVSVVSESSCESALRATGALKVTVWPMAPRRALMACASACTAGGCESPAMSGARALQVLHQRDHDRPVRARRARDGEPQAGRDRAREALHLGGAQREPVVGVRTRERGCPPRVQPVQRRVAVTDAPPLRELACQAHAVRVPSRKSDSSDRTTSGSPGGSAPPPAGRTRASRRARVVGRRGLVLMPARLRVLLEQGADLGRQRRRRDRLGQDAQARAASGFCAARAAFNAATNAPHERISPAVSRSASGRGRRARGSPPA